MDCYIIAVGGTGSRVMRAITHLMASGAFVDSKNQNMKNLGKIRFMCVDSDVTNGDKTRMEQTAQNYINIYNAGTVSRELVRPFPAQPNKFEWSPLEMASSTMGNMEAYALMDSSLKELYDFLYTEDERDLPLKGGFYSHTSIGSYYMTNGIVDDNGNFKNEWQTFFQNITPDDKIVIICSMFGGTGASGVPTLGRRIKENAKTKDCQIAGIFLEPYFQNIKKDGEQSIINWEQFCIKSRIAFEYYRNQKFEETIFDKMYFLGEESNKLMPVEDHIDLSEQLNKANVIELYAATAVIDFIKNPENKSIDVTFRGTQDKDFIFSQQSLNSVQGTRVFDKMSRFFQFSVLYTKFLYHAIIKGDKKACKWLNNYNFYDMNGEVASGVIDLYEYCKKYMAWIREIITEADGTGKFSEEWLSDPGTHDNIYTDWFARRQFELYDGNEILSSTYQEKCRVLDKYTSDDLPGFSKMIRGKETRTAEFIYTELCEHKTKVIKDLKGFVVDVLRLSETGTIN